MTDTVENYEAQLDSFDPSQRSWALKELAAKVQAGEISLPKAGKEHNMHFHTFFSYNAYGYSPSKVAWLAKKEGLGLAAVCDFDVLDAVEEFYEAAEILNLKASAGIETRVFVPEFADKEISSPGEPGIAYHMGIGMPKADPGNEGQAFLTKLKQTAQQRNQSLMDRVNPFLVPASIDYEKDLVALTPAGSPTERHMCLAYARKAASLFPEEAELRSFWIEKLGPDAESVDLPEGSGIEGLIRKKTMKKGGVGYVVPDSGSFPTMEEMNRFVIQAGGIPCHTWLNGMSDGEQEIEKLLEIGMSTGVAAINIIPDRNFTPGKGLDDAKCKNLYHVVDLAKKLDLPIHVGTEMNSPGLKFVDNFASGELKPLLDDFYKGSLMTYAHAMLQRHAGMGYLSDWANGHFKSRAEKNTYFAQLGEKISAANVSKLAGLDANQSPGQVQAHIENM